MSVNRNIILRLTDERNAAGRRLYEVMRDVVIGGIEVRYGFKTDMISARPWMLLLLTDWQQADKAAILHDYLLSRVGRSVRTRTGGLVGATTVTDRHVADREFYEQMNRDGVGWWTRTVMYYAVRLRSWWVKRK